MIKLTSVLLLAVLTCDQTNDIHAFAPFSSLPSSTSSTSSASSTTSSTTSTSSFIRAPLLLLLQAKTIDEEDDEAWDSPEDYNDDNSSSSSSSSSRQPSLGINLDLEPLTAEQAAELKKEAAQKINDAFDGRIDQLANLKQSVSDDFEKSKQSLQYASELRAQEETSKLMNKIDSMSDAFLKNNEELRMGTKMSARADRDSMGKGLEVGSWGRIGGMDVGMGMGMESLNNGLLGSVGSVISTTNAGDVSAATSIMGEGQEVVVEEVENRILVICDDKQDKKVQQVIDRFQSLITDQFDTPVQIETIKPTANIPMGGNNAQCVILSSTSLSNGQSSANNILSRVLRRTISPGGGKVAKPPSHFVVISPLGTERIDKYPYSMTNMMGGNKLKKAREVEEVIISTIKGRLVADSSIGVGPSLDYTILKLGDIVNDEQVMKDKKNGIMDVAPGDKFDGKVGIEAAANTLLQAVALRPLARNATLSVIGGMATSKGGDEVISEEQWDDWFLRLDGPELWRSEEGLLVDGTVDADRKFEELAGYINEWSNMFKNGAKGTGLTTPVNVVLSNFDEKQNASLIRSTFGVRLEFKPTNTGSSYQSKGEEKELESQRSAPAKSTGPVVFKNKKQRREGGVEILVELSEDKNGGKELRVRARRCNMDDFTVVKELSEETIVKQLGKAVNVWKK